MTIQRLTSKVQIKSIFTAEDEQLDLGFIEIEDEDNDVLDVNLHSMNEVALRAR